MFALLEALPEGIWWLIAIAGAAIPVSNAIDSTGNAVQDAGNAALSTGEALALVGAVFIAGKLAKAW